MQTSEFNAMNRQWEDQELNRYLDSMDDYLDDDDREIQEECRECSQRGPKCFRCGYGG